MSTSVVSSKRVSSLLFGILFAASVLFAATGSGPKKPADLSKLVVVGDSLSAGVQNFSLLESQQVHGYAYVIAQQAGASLTLPMVPYPGLPNVLQLVNWGPPPDIQPAPGTLSMPRLNPTEQPTDVAVPGQTVGQALTMRPTFTPTNPVEIFANVVLGFPTPFVFPGEPQTQIEQAVALKPTTAIVWLGNNDALVPAMIGTLDALTDPSAFNDSYDAVLEAIGSTGASIVTANIPDIAAIPFFTSAETIAEQAHLPVSALEGLLGIVKGDYVRPSALPFVSDILTGKTAGPLQQICPASYGLPASQVPCVLRKREVRRLRGVIAAYNHHIAYDAAMHHAVLFNAHAWFDRMGTQGYQAGQKHLTTAFLGGIISLDGIHPTRTGYAIIANEFIKRMNEEMGTHIPPANVAEIAASDPLVF